MRALIVEHLAHEGAGLVGAALAAAGVTLDVRRTWANDALPPPDGYDLVVVLGGPMSAWDDALASEAELLATSTRQGRFTIGICLGAQLLARGLGARVERGRRAELGLLPIALTDAGRAEPLFADLDGARVLHWHHDSFALPAGAVLLASSAAYANQAFRVGARSFGVQFHPECDRAMRADWARRGAAELLAAGIDPASLSDDASAPTDAHGRAFAAAVARLLSPSSPSSRA
jgi:GMP synthase (glutamine-hydrolysing)